MMGGQEISTKSCPGGSTASGVALNNCFGIYDRGMHWSPLMMDGQEISAKSYPGGSTANGVALNNCFGIYDQGMEQNFSTSN